MARKFRRQSFASCSKGRSIACACRKTCLSAGKTEHCAVGFMVDVPFGLHRVPREQRWKVEVGCGLVATLILTAVGGLIGAMEHIHPLDRQECLSVRSSDEASSASACSC